MPNSLPESGPPASDDALPSNDQQILALAVRGTVLFPISDALTPLLVSREKSLAALEAAMMADRRILVVAQREIETESVSGQDLFTVGTLALINRILRLPDGTTSVLVEGRARMRIEAIEQENPYLVVRASRIGIVGSDQERLNELGQAVLELFEKAVDQSEDLEKESYVRALNAATPGELADVVASSLEPPYLQAQELLEIENATDRLQRVRSILESEIAVLSAQRRIREGIAARVEEEHQEEILRGQMAAILEEIGDSDAASRDVRDLTKRLTKGRYPKSVRSRIEKDLARLGEIPQGSPELNVLRNYLECLLDLPWRTYTNDRIDLPQAKAILDAGHYGLDDVKERILEFLAVRN